MAAQPFATGPRAQVGARAKGVDNDYEPHSLHGPKGYEIFV
jgi:hypothetical protein